MGFLLGYRLLVPSWSNGGIHCGKSIKPGTAISGPKRIQFIPEGTGGISDTRTALQHWYGPDLRLRNEAPETYSKKNHVKSGELWSLRNFEGFIFHLKICLLICDAAVTGCGSIACSPLAGGLISGEYEGMDFLQSSNDPGGVPLQTAARLALLEHQQQLCTGIEPDKPRDRTYSDVSSQIHKLKFLRPLTEQLGCSMAQLSIAWCLRSDLVQSVLISPVTLEQLREQLLALSVIDKLTPEVLAVMEKILGNQPSLGMTKSKNSAKKDPNSRRRSVRTQRWKSATRSGLGLDWV